MDSHSSPVAHCSPFQWKAALDAAALRSDWQNHLTRFVVANATVSVTPGTGKPLHLDKVTLVGDPLNLYQVTNDGQEMVVRVAYARLREAFMDVLYDCHLLVKTGAGGRFITIPAPKPPSRTEWKQVLNALWSQLLLAEDVVLAFPEAPGSLPVSQQPAAFTLDPAPEWEEAGAWPLGGAVSEWQREVRFVPGRADPGTVGVQINWLDWQWVSDPTQELLSLPNTQDPLNKPGQVKRYLSLWMKGKQAFSLPLRVSSFPWSERWQSVPGVRLAFLGAGCLLLCLFGVIMISAPTRGATAEKPLSALHSSFMSSPVPSGTPSPLPPPANAPQPSPAPRPSSNAPQASPAPSPQPSAPAPSTPVSAPTAPPVSTPTPSPTPPSSPTSTPSPTPTTTPPPIPTDTPPSVPTDTPTPASTGAPAPGSTDIPSPTPPSLTPPSATDPPMPPDTPSPGLTSLIRFCVASPD